MFVCHTLSVVESKKFVPNGSDEMPSASSSLPAKTSVRSIDFDALESGVSTLEDQVRFQVIDGLRSRFPGENEEELLRKHGDLVVALEKQLGAYYEQLMTFRSSLRRRLSGE